jgi:hypothetical protein
VQRQKPNQVSRNPEERRREEDEKKYYLISSDKCESGMSSEINIIVLKKDQISKIANTVFVVVVC